VYVIIFIATHHFRAAADGAVELAVSRRRRHFDADDVGCDTCQGLLASLTARDADDRNMSVTAGNWHRSSLPVG